MLVLAIDTSGSGCFAAVYDGGAGELLACAGADIGRGHAERLMEFVDEALSASGRELGEIDRIAVTIGPGSFTGIRVGVAAARGLALALGKPAVGITTLHVVAESARLNQAGQPVLVVLDAKRDEVYLQAFDASGRPQGEAEILPAEEARLRFSAFAGIACGSGAPAVTGAAGGKPDEIDMAALARLGAAADPVSARPEPLYLRGPDAKPQAGFAVTRA
ncbi:tRNA (adenosine(37)-N6)-threonylcarbamoyltransferase complex dimerization subunit type 1 TsaB [Sinorhizobium meliloti]|uniref:tRNA (adenosine(37)-N6)-threonylcarbamoyltransferase complex dimerization subunit type 1 TsaB n=1 Tax=Rhizobium meliloti TaxID=382 RepID=UPI000B4A2294|nr:tRNA (adenosine(37)-N6)-threonylcarbamoyltransferase complex dimerization subunit type 1 TsaB [Sinorhizobium meliloti]ASP64789.1 tRNA (adenosine(37)-N6)-threonylcarbamoyltransferase complex dimerization subunit type 1 TsaB [Sinorhizobium meliloti]MQX00133.1 tRNA (adenosine(37)-N6)-threonylcarbamoyltransferase complex dimerization subunit type 1 TsaB [Sinorhizobium meliloti]RVK43739.1 tRNA (adenosine(37)-N6)-threonylcarbamoyltransferase complex dimerization subunit type 1 TsaB [Sinorhizobium m